jgi:hypothetical protein
VVVYCYFQLVVSWKYFQLTVPKFVRKYVLQNTELEYQLEILPTLNKLEVTKYHHWYNRTTEPPLHTQQRQTKNHSKKKKIFITMMKTGIFIFSSSLLISCFSNKNFHQKYFIKLKNI